MNKIYQNSLRLVLFASLSAAMVSAEAASIRGLGILPGDIGSYAYGISADGKTVVGQGDSGEYSYQGKPHRPLKWTQAGGMTALSSSNYSGYGVGAANNGDVFGTVHAEYDETLSVRWNADTIGYHVPLSKLPGHSLAYLKAVTPDGKTIVGKSHTEFPWESDDAAFYAKNGVAKRLNAVKGKHNPEANGVSADGRYIVGSSGDQATMWQLGKNDKQTVLTLGTLPGHKYSSATAISADGSTVVGSSGSEDQAQAFMWRKGKMEGLGDMTGATAISAKGDIVVGNNGLDAAIWHNKTTRHLADYLLSKGVNLSMWQRLREAAAISANGHFVAGWGINLLGKKEAFLADLRDSVAAVAEPANVSLLALGGLLMLRLGRKKVALKS